jgi:GntR family transcriptional regulator, transcriptional repressor for pyruvate dehydrogenase complex
MTTNATIRARSANGAPGPRGPVSGHQAEGGTGQVVAYVRDLIERGELKPGDRLPAERDLATEIGVSRPTIRAGLRTLAAMGVVRSRHGSGTYIPEGPPALNTDALSFLAALHGFTREEMYEARRILEVGAAGLAAERATAEQVATLAEEVASLFAAMQEPRVFLVHDINFHRAVAAASGNPIVASLVEMVSALYYERRRETAAAASERDLRDAAEMHRRIYQAIRARDADTARRAMHDHLLQASRHQAQEPAADADMVARRPVRQAQGEPVRPAQGGAVRAAQGGVLSSPPHSQRSARVRRRPSSI